jgi:hypothetical protein
MKSEKKTIEVTVDNDEKVLALYAWMNSIEYAPKKESSKKSGKEK